MFSPGEGDTSTPITCGGTIVKTQVLLCYKSYLRLGEGTDSSGSRLSLGGPKSVYGPRNKERPSVAFSSKFSDLIKQEKESKG